MTRLNVGGEYVENGVSVSADGYLISSLFLPSPIVAGEYVEEGVPVSTDVWTPGFYYRRGVC